MLVLAGGLLTALDAGTHLQLEVHRWGVGVGAEILHFLTSHVMQHLLLFLAMETSS